MWWGFSLQFWQAVIVWGTIISAVSGGISIAAALISALVGYRVSDIAQSDADKRIAEAAFRGEEARAEAARANSEVAKANLSIAAANARAAEANQKTEEERLARVALEAKLAPRRLTLEQRASLTSLFAKYPGRTVRVASYALDADAAILGLQLIDAAVAAGLNVADMRMSEGPLGSVAFGVLVDGTDTKLVGELLPALNLLGLAASPGAPPPSAGQSLGGQQAAFSVKIFIGVKPIEVRAHEVNPLPQAAP